MSRPSDSQFYELMVQSQARMEDKLNRLFDRKTTAEKISSVLRTSNRRLREELAKLKLYVRELENELRLKGIE